MFGRNKAQKDSEKENMAENVTENETSKDEILEEIEHVNEARINKTADQEEEQEEQETVKEPEISAEEKLKTELTAANDKFLRLYAEFDNFKRRTTKERIELLQTAGKDVIIDLLPVLDDFDRALKAMETAVDIEPVKEGINLVQQKLKNMLVQKGLKEMNAREETFNPDIHEAITNIPAPSDELKGKVIDEVEKGYYLNDKVIRFAKVVVGA